MTEFVYFDALADEVLKAFKAKRWRFRAPCKSSYHRDDRRLARLFDGGYRMDAREAVARGLALYSGGYDPYYAGEALKWGFKQGLVGFSEAKGHPEWTLLRHGVNFVPHEDGSVDVRKVEHRVGKRSLDAVVRMEARRRLNRYAKDLAQAQFELRSHLWSMDPKVILSDEFGTTDLPPVSTVGELRDNLDGYEKHFLLFRARQILRQLCCLPYRDADEDEEITIDAPELDGFYL